MLGQGHAVIRIVVDAGRTLDSWTPVSTFTYRDWHYMQAGLTPGPHWRAWGTGPDMQDQPLLDSPPWLHEGTVKFF